MASDRELREFALDCSPGQGRRRAVPSTVDTARVVGGEEFLSRPARLRTHCQSASSWWKLATWPGSTGSVNRRVSSAQSR
jgi:hypothetical protein